MERAYNWQTIRHIAAELAEVVPVAVVVAVVVAVAMESEKFVAVGVGSFVAELAAPDRWLAVEDSFVELELGLVLELASVLMFGIAAEHKAAAVECRSVAVECS